MGGCPERYWKAALPDISSLSPPGPSPGPDSSVPTANTNQLCRQLVSGKIEAVGERKRRMSWIDGTCMCMLEGPRILIDPWERYTERVSQANSTLLLWIHWSRMPHLISSFHILNTTTVGDKNFTAAQKQMVLSAYLCVFILSISGLLKHLCFTIWFSVLVRFHQLIQQCIPVGCVAPTHWPYLVLSYTPPCNHACPPATMHAPQQPHMPPQQPCTPPSNHTCPPATTHVPRQPCTPPSNHTCPLATMHAPSATMHAPWQPHMPPLWTEFLTLASENITLPQTSFAGGNKSWDLMTDCTLFSGTFRVKIIS